MDELFTGEPWEDVQDRFQAAFPDLDPGEMRKRYLHVQKLQQARDRYAGAQMPRGVYAATYLLPGFSMGVRLGHAIDYGKAQKRVLAGEPEEGDYDTIAHYERLQGLDKERNKTWGGFLGHTAARLPAMGVELAAGGVALKGLGAGAGAAAEGAAGAATYAARAGLTGAGLRQTAALTALTPSVWAEHAVNYNIKEGRDPLDPRGLPGAYALGVAQLATLRAVGAVAGNALPYSGARQVAGRTASAAGLGVAGQQAADVGTSALDDVARSVTGSSWGLDTGYGTLGQLVKEGPDSALKHAVGTALTFAVLHAAHEATGPRRPASPESFASPEAGAAYRAYRPQGPHAGYESAEAANPILSAVAQAAQQMARRGDSAQRAGEQLATRLEEAKRQVEKAGPDELPGWMRDELPRILGDLEPAGKGREARLPIPEEAGPAPRDLGIPKSRSFEERFPAGTRVNFTDPESVGAAQPQRLQGEVQSHLKDPVTGEPFAVVRTPDNKLVPAGDVHSIRPMAPAPETAPQTPRGQIEAMEGRYTEVLRTIEDSTRKERLLQQEVAAGRPVQKDLAEATRDRAAAQREKKTLERTLDVLRGQAAAPAPPPQPPQPGVRQEAPQSVLTPQMQAAAREAFPQAVRPPSSTGLAEAGGEMGQAVVGNLYQGLFDALRAGKSTFSGVKDPVLAKAKPAFEQGLLRSPQDLQKLVNAGYDPQKAGLLQAGPPPADPATGIINPVQTGVPGIRSGAVEVPVGNSPPVPLQPPLAAGKKAARQWSPEELARLEKATPEELEAAADRLLQEAAPETAAGPQLPPELVRQLAETPMHGHERRTLEALLGGASLRDVGARTGVTHEGARRRAITAIGKLRKAFPEQWEGVLSPEEFLARGKAQQEQFLREKQQGGELGGMPADRARSAVARRMRELAEQADREVDDAVQGALEVGRAHGLDEASVRRGVGESLQGRRPEGTTAGPPPRAAGEAGPRPEAPRPAPGATPQAAGHGLTSEQLGAVARAWSDLGGAMRPVDAARLGEAAGTMLGRGLAPEQARAAMEALRAEGMQIPEGWEAPSPWAGMRGQSAAGWAEQARQAGVDPHTLEGEARRIVAQSEAVAGDYNGIRAELKRHLGKAGEGHARLVHLERYQDATDVPGIDEAGMWLQEAYPSLVRRGESGSEAAFRLLKEGRQAPLTVDEARQRALDAKVAQREQAAVQKEIEDATREEVGRGRSEASVRQDVRLGEEAGRRESEAREAEGRPDEAPGQPAPRDPALEGDEGAGRGAGDGGDASFDFGANRGTRPGESVTSSEPNRGVSRGDEPLGPVLARDRPGRGVAQPFQPRPPQNPAVPRRPLVTPPPPPPRQPPAPPGNSPPGGGPPPRPGMMDDIKKVLAPASRGPAAARTAEVMRHRLADMARSQERASDTLRAAEQHFDSFPPAERLDRLLEFTDAIEGGRIADLPNEPVRMDLAGRISSWWSGRRPPTIREVAQAIRDLNDQRERQLVERGLIQSTVENYLGHLWKKPGTDATPEQLGAILASRRPLAGSEAYRRERTLPTYRDGVEAGLEPVDTNPVRLALLKMREVDRSIMAHDVRAELGEQGLRTFVRREGRAPEGWVRGTDRGDVRADGAFYYPEPAARLLDNYLQPGLRGWRPYDAVRAVGNVQNLFQLGFSAFHLGFVTMDNITSGVALGLQYMSRGEFARGAGKIGRALTGPFSTYLEGSKLLKEYYSPGSQGAETAAMIDALQEAGGRAKMDAFYHNDHLGRFRRALAEVQGGDAKSAPALLHALPAFAEVLSKPVMENIVPRMKLGIFAELARNELDRLGPGVDLNARRAALGRAWDSVDNRLGQVVYDNLFWSRAFKDSLMAGVRSVGWNLGTWRELGGGIKDIPESVRGIASGEGITPRTAYVIALPMAAAFFGSLYHYLATGQPPDDLRDAIFPKTGGTRRDGTPDRVSLPSYMRDVAGLTNRADEGPNRWAKNAWTMAKHKVHPTLTSAAEALDNQDFYGNAIWRPEDRWLRQSADLAKHLMLSLEPFASRGFRQQRQQGAGAGQALQSFVGITPGRAQDVQTWEEQRRREAGRHFYLTPLERRRRQDAGR